jgi:glycosyltransferase involved in cell wall biosynthesis
MLKPITVAFVADHYVTWVGGASILGFLLDGMLRAAPAQRATLHLLLSAKMLPEPMRDEVPNCVAVPTEHFSRIEGPLRCLLDAAPGLQQLVFYKDLHAAMDTLGVDVVGPTGLDLGADFPRPWFGYIPDFQHQYLPQFFVPSDLTARDAHFRAMVQNSVGIFVNSATVAADVVRFYPGAMVGKRVLRFPQIYPDVRAGFGTDPAATLHKHGLHGVPYLLSCSQRWKHKQHDVLVQGFADFLQADPTSPLQLVFTGDAHDYRNPGHAAEVDALIGRLGLRERVKQLGLVPRAEQLQLIAAAQALVAASLFEGGPGASGASEAALLGTTVLASDIEANRELAFGRCLFFQTHSSRSLAAGIQGLGSTPAQPHRHAPYPLEQLPLLATASGLQTLAALRAALR